MATNDVSGFIILDRMVRVNLFNVVCKNNNFAIKSEIIKKLK
jgi:hypothetical protein